uniref:Transposase Tc1-like domain-containing protein n=1 Tax=Lates calcarifer TaxID=8187 RepID=A0A4W6E0U1_LATCA
MGKSLQRIIKLLKEGKSSRSVAKDVGCSQSAVPKIWTKYKQHGKVVKGRPRKTSKRQDRKLKAICLDNRKCTAKQMRNKWEETGVNVCDRTRKTKRKPSLTPKQKKTRLQWAKEKQSWTVNE